MAKKKQTVAEGMRSRIPALDGYLTRIGAEELNFRRFMVKEYRKGKNYYIEKTLIKINPDGTIYCSRKDHSPTDGEAKAIMAALQNVELPRSIGASVRAAEVQAEKIGGEVYLFPSRSDGTIQMLQHKFINASGAKVYVAWTFWSDGVWRRMEPDGDLPFWKPLLRAKEQAVGLKMIHEGAKAAKFITELLKNPKGLAQHPWGDALRLYEHWGMIGGALAPHRTDYGELLAEKPTEVIYVCDNDFSGKSALQVVSRCYGESLIGIKFGEDFPQSWDMADPVPASQFSGTGKRRRYIGKPLRNFMKPATWATEVIPIPGTKKTTTVLRRPFIEEWVHSIRPEVYMHRHWAYDVLTDKEFNNKISPYSDADDVARLIRKDDTSKAVIIKYDPGHPTGLYEDQGTYINTHMESDVIAEEGDVRPFLEFMENLVEEERDRLELMRWCATLIDRPSVKMTYGVLLISETQGVGKGTLGEKILGPLVGASNVSTPSETDIVDGQFNPWMAHKRLAIVHEIYAGHSSKAYNRLKSLITDRSVSVNRKFMAQYDIENWLHVFACSNSMRALKLSMDDRRWYLPKITDRKLGKEYWIDFNDWLTNQGGLGKIKHWASQFLEDNLPVVEGEEAPSSTVKDEVIEDSYSPGMRLVANTLRQIQSVLEGSDDDDRKQLKEWEASNMVRDGKVVVLDVDLVSLIHSVIYQGKQTDRLEKPLTMRNLAKGLGWHVGKSPVSSGMKAWGEQARKGGGRVISNDLTFSQTSPAVLGGKTGEKLGMSQIRPLNLDWAKVM